MKKALTILAAVVLIASGMHISLASHYCAGKLAAVKISLTGERAGCGMEECTTNTNTGENSYNGLCCEDHISDYSLCSYEYTTSTELTLPGQKLPTFQDAPGSLLTGQEYTLGISGSNLSPPGEYQNSQSCPVLCTFRL